MIVFPAIDLRQGRCVRLYQGDYARETVFSENPVEVALKWKSYGATRLHIVDLDGAATGKLHNLNIIEEIVKQSGLSVQLGGGIRDETTVEKLTAIGIKRIILGTVAIEQPDIIEKLCRTYSESLIIGIDARDGFVATHGWQKGTAVTALELGQKMADIGIQRILYTDIKRDGTLTEPGFDAISELVSNVGLPVIAAGGISALSHLEKLRKIGVEGAIIGKALYTNHINLKEALAIEGS